MIFGKYDYPLEIKKTVAYLIGKDSKIYEDMMNGVEISYSIKKLYKTKGKCRIKRIDELKELSKKCKQFEDGVDKETQINVTL